MSQENRDIDQESLAKVEEFYQAKVYENVSDSTEKVNACLNAGKANFVRQLKAFIPDFKAGEGNCLIYKKKTTVTSTRITGAVGNSTAPIKVIMSTFYDKYVIAYLGSNENYLREFACKGGNFCGNPHHVQFRDKSTGEIVDIPNFIIPADYKRGKQPFLIFFAF
jgi:hypothetical protein